jgi:hypothetical protein
MRILNQCNIKNTSNFSCRPLSIIDLLSQIYAQKFNQTDSVIDEGVAIICRISDIIFFAKQREERFQIVQSQ